jgi:trans-aconitate methyltransferase
MREWNAPTYHRVSDPMLNMGLTVLERLPLRGDEFVVDAGCGTGRVTAVLLERLPRGGVLAIDLSANMLATAREFLSGTPHSSRVRFVRADAAALPVSAAADAVFSTATFHWIADHDQLFRSVHTALRPGGRLVAQCGGGPNLRRVQERCLTLMRRPEFDPYFRSWGGSWNFADGETTARRLAAAGFVDAATSLEPARVVLAGKTEYKEFVTNVVCRAHLARLPDDFLRTQFMDALTQQAALDVPPFELDYWRLNMSARKP